MTDQTREAEERREFAEWWTDLMRQLNRVGDPPETAWQAWLERARRTAPVSGQWQPIETYKRTTPALVCSRNGVIIAVTDVADHSVCDITHWMPLPAPPTPKPEGETT